MDLNEFIKNFVEQLDVKDPATITADTVFENLDEWCSMTALSVIAMVGDKYDVAIGGDIIQDSSTINDLFERIKSAIRSSKTMTKAILDEIGI